MSTVIDDGCGDHSTERNSPAEWSIIRAYAPLQQISWGEVLAVRKMRTVTDESRLSK